MPTHDISTTTAGPGPRTGKSISKPAGISRRILCHRTYSISLSKGTRTESMKKLLTRGWMITVLVPFAALSLYVTPVLAHHSFAMYDQTKTLVLTCVAYQFVAQANHAELHFYVIGPDGKLLKDKDGKNADWGAEMAGAAAMAQQGITAAAFPAGTIFSI